MTDNIDVIISGDREVALKFDKFPAALHDPLLAKITTLTNTLRDMIRSGAPRKSGKLQGDIDARVFSDNPDRIVGYISVADDFAKAGALEYGAHRATQVGAHSGRLDHAWGKRMNAPITVMVAAYSRRPNLAATRFLRGPTEAMTGEIEAQLQQTVDQATQQFSQ